MGGGSVAVGVGVAVGAGVSVAVAVAVAVAVHVGVGVVVFVGVAVGVSVGVAVEVAVGSGVNVAVGGRVFVIVGAWAVWVAKISAAIRVVCESDSSWDGPHADSMAIVNRKTKTVMILTFIMKPSCPNLANLIISTLAASLKHRLPPKQQTGRPSGICACRRCCHPCHSIYQSPPISRGKNAESHKPPQGIRHPCHLSLRWRTPTTLGSTVIPVVGGTGWGGAGLTILLREAPVTK